MDFINKVGSTIARKAKEAAGISNLNSQIGAQEAIINKLCLEIGKTVYEKRQLFPDSALDEKIHCGVECLCGDCPPQIRNHLCKGRKAMSKLRH